MEAQIITPCAPPGAHAEGVEHVETSRKPEGMMSKVKRKARKLRDRIKKAAGTDTTDNDHEDDEQEDELHQRASGPEDEEVDEGGESCEDDEEKHDHVNPADNQFKREQLRSIGKLDNQEGGPEVEVHSARPDTRLKSADDVPISPYKNGPPEASQTKHGNYSEPLLQLGGEEKRTDTFDYNGVWPAEGINPRGQDQQPDSIGLPPLAEAKMATSPAGASRISATSDMDVTYLEDLVKPNPEFGRYGKIGVMIEELPTDRKKLDTSEDNSTKGKEDLLVPEHAELGGYQSSASMPVKGDELVYMPVSETSGCQSSAPMPIQADEEVERPVSNSDGWSSLTPPPGILDEVVIELNGIAQVVGPGHNIDNNAVRAFENDLEYPSTKNTEDHMEAPAPECAKLSGYQSSALAPAEGDELVHIPISESSGCQSSAPMPIEADEVVQRPVSNGDEGSSYTPPPGILDEVVKELNGIAQVVGPGHSIDHNAVRAFECDLEYPSTHGDVKSSSLEQSPLGETAEPEKNWYTHTHNEVKDEESSLISPPGILDDATYAQNEMAQRYGTNQSSENGNRAFAKESDYPSTSVEEKLINNTADDVKNLSLEHLALGETAEPEKIQQERWCSADKNTTPKNVVTTGLLGSDNRSECKTQQSGTEAGGDRAPNLQDDEYVDALSKPRFSEDARKGADEETFYEPNDDKDNQFQEGFAHCSGNADEDAIDSSQPGSAIGKLQGLKDIVVSTLGYGDKSSHHTGGGEDEEENPYSKRENVNFPPTQQQTRFNQEPKDTVASTFGYGKESADEFSHTDVSEQSCVAEEEHKPEVDIDGSQPQPGGVLQGLKNVLASKLGYGTGGELPSPPSENVRTDNAPVEAVEDVQPRYDDGEEHGGVGKAGYASNVAGDDAASQNMHTLNTPVETTADAQPLYDDGGEHGGVGKAGYASSVAGDIAGEPHSPQPTGFFQGMKNMVASTLGYKGSEELHSTATGNKTHDKVPLSST